MRFLAATAAFVTDSPSRVGQGAQGLMSRYDDLRPLGQSRTSQD
jgi:hypothetical protein